MEHANNSFSSSLSLNPSTGDAIRRGLVSNVLYKVGDEPGFFAVLSASSVQEAQVLIDRAVEDLYLFDVQIIPVNQFPHFD
jgi:hypothetical protein